MSNQKCVPSRMSTCLWILYSISLWIFNCSCTGNPVELCRLFYGTNKGKIGFLLRKMSFGLKPTNSIIMKQNLFKNRPRLKGIAQTVYQQLKEKLEFLLFYVTSFYQPLKESVYLGFVRDILVTVLFLRLILLKVETCLQISLLYCADVLYSMYTIHINWFASWFSCVY